MDKDELSIPTLGELAIAIDEWKTVLTRIDLLEKDVSVITQQLDKKVEELKRARDRMAGQESRIQALIFKMR